MKSVPVAISIVILGGLGACTPAARKGTHYLSIRNDATQDVYVTYGGGVAGVSATIAPSSRVVMRGEPFEASVFASTGVFDYYISGEYVYRGAGLLGTFDALDARMLPSGDQVRIYEANGALRAEAIGFAPSSEANR